KALTQANSTTSNWRLTSACGELGETSKKAELGKTSMLSSMPTAASSSLIIAMRLGRNEAGGLPETKIRSDEAVGRVPQGAGAAPPASAIQHLLGHTRVEVGILRALLVRPRP